MNAPIEDEDLNFNLILTEWRSVPESMFQSIFCAQFLKIELSVQILMSFCLQRGAIELLLNYYLWGAVTDKCYANKREKIEALKKTHKICNTIAEIGLHAVENVLGPSVLSTA